MNLSVPHKRNLLPIGRPRGRLVVERVARQVALVSAIGVHDEDLARAVEVAVIRRGAFEGDRAPVRRPNRRLVRPGLLVNHWTSPSAFAMAISHVLARLVKARSDPEVAYRRVLRFASTSRRNDHPESEEQ